MKKMTKFFGFSAFAGMLLFAVACNSGDDSIGEGTVSGHYISSYMIPEYIKFDYIELYDRLNIDIDGSGVSRSEYESLAEKYNDLNYNKPKATPTLALYDGIDSLSVFTVDYFNEAYPAGSNVSDIVKCKYLTYYDFISSGYVPIEEEYENTGLIYSGGTKLYEMGLSEVNYNNSQLMTNEMVIEFTAEPETSGTYKFEFHFNMPEVRLEGTFEYIFQ